MESKYFCEICGTKPDQLSHHKAHLQSQKHAENCEIFKKDMRIFSITFRHVNFRKWQETEYSDYIIAKYLEETNSKTYTNEDVMKWIYQTVLSYGNGKYDWSLECFDSKIPQTCYEDEFKCKLEKGIDITNTHYNDWAIHKILKYKETIQSKTVRIKYDVRKEQLYKSMLFRHTNMKYNKIKDIRNGLIDLSFLLKPRDNLTSENIEIYDDNALRYSCLLFHYYGIHSLYIMYNGIAGCIDIEEHPEEKKYNSFYFWKDVEIEHSCKIANVSGYGETRMEKKKIWTSCYMGDVIDYFEYMDFPREETNTNTDVPVINFSYISDDDFKYFAKESLIEIFSNKIKHSENQLLEKKNESFQPKWLKHHEKIVCKHIIEKDEIVFGGVSNDYQKYVVKQNRVHEEDDQRQPIDVKPKLTEEQILEMDQFYNEKEKCMNELEEEKKHYESELLKVRELNISSDLFKSIIHICHYFFEYNDDLIEYYKKHMYVHDMNIEKEKMVQRALEEDEYP